MLRILVRGLQAACAQLHDSLLYAAGALELLVLISTTSRSSYRARSVLLQRS